MVKDPIVQLTLARDTPVLYRELISSCVETRFWWALSSAFNFLGTLLNRIEKRCFTSRRFIACVYGTDVWDLSSVVLRQRRKESPR